MEVEVECQLAIGSHSNGKTKSMENGSIIKEKRQHQKRVLLLKGKREIPRSKWMNNALKVKAF